MQPRSAPLRCLACLLAAGLCCWLPACSLFDTTLIERQQAEIERLRQESLALKQEIESLQQQRQQEDKEREACNRAFFLFDAARKAATPEEAIERYREGLALCPKDDVAHNELGELYLQLGRTDEAVAEFHEALRLNPNFSRAQKNLDAARTR